MLAGLHRFLKQRSPFYRFIVRTVGLFLHVTVSSCVSHDVSTSIGFFRALSRLKAVKEQLSKKRILEAIYEVMS